MVSTSKLDIHKNQTLTSHLNRFFPLKIKDNYIDFQNRTLIMGILNVTPDSFYDGGKYLSVDECLKRIEQMIEEGADIIDIGAESTRPGSKSVSSDEELNRIVPILEESIKSFETIFSVDTTKSLVAKEVLELGVPIINDISGLKFDPEIANYVSKHNATLVLMHIPAHPSVMQNHTDYDSLIEDIIVSLSQSIDTATKNGVNLENIVIDPGIGFGKTAEQNLEVLIKLNDFLALQRPILIGTSRKSFIGKLLGDLPVEKRLEGTAATVATAIANGASIVRVHDVYEMKLVAKMTDSIYDKH